MRGRDGQKHGEGEKQNEKNTVIWRKTYGKGPLI